MSDSEAPEERDVPAVHRARARPIAEMRRDRIAEVESLLAAGKTRRQVRAGVAQKWGITANAARRYVRAVDMLWDGEAKRSGTQEDRASRRSHIEAMLMSVIEKGMKRRGLALDREGGEHWYDNPDVRGVVAACETLARMHGIIEPDTKGAGAALPGQTLVLLQQFFGVRQAPGDAPTLPTVQTVRVVEAPQEDD